MTTGRRRGSSGNTLSHITFGTLELHIKQRVEVLLHGGVLHVDLAIWTLQERMKYLKSAKRLHVESKPSPTEDEM